MRFRCRISRKPL